MDSRRDQESPPPFKPDHSLITYIERGRWEDKDRGWLYRFFKEWWRQLKTWFYG